MFFAGTHSIAEDRPMMFGRLLIFSHRLVPAATAALWLAAPALAQFPLSPPATKYAYVANAADAISVIDTTTDTLLFTNTLIFSDNGTPFPPFAGPSGVAVNANVALLSFLNPAPTARTDLNNMALIAPLSPLAQAFVPFGTGASTTLSVASPDNNYFYVVGIDSAENTSILQIQTVGVLLVKQTYSINAVIGMAVSPDGSTLYVARINTTQITIVDTATGYQTTFDPGVYVYQLAAAPDGRTLYGAVGFAQNGFQGIVAMDLVAMTTTFHPVPPVNSGGSIIPLQMVENGDGSRLFVSDYYQNAIYVINTTTSPSWTTATISLPSTPLTATSQIALSNDNKKLYVVSNQQNAASLLAFDTTTLDQVASIPLPTTFPSPSGGITATSGGNFLGIAIPTPVAPPPPVTVTPSPDTLYANQSVTLTAGSLQPADTVTWSLAQGALGSLTNLIGAMTTYTAPALVPVFQGAPVTATVTNPALITRTATANIELEPAIVVSVVPQAPVLNPLYPGQSQALTATVANASTTEAVTWSIPAGAPGTITTGFNPQTGVSTCTFTYSGPPVTKTTQVVVTATSQVDNTTAGTYTLTLSPPVAVNVTPGSGTIASGGSQQFTAQVLNTTNTALTWTASAGSLSANAGSPVTWTAPTITSATQATITATSVFDNTKSGTATFQVSAAMTAITCEPTGDAAPSVADVQLIINEALGTAPPMHALTGGGTVTVGDIQTVVNAVLGLGCTA
jgi:hypothetical protein